MYGGTYVTAKDKFNFIILITILYKNNNNKNFMSVCTGNLIRQDLVLTAAHCVNNSIPNFVKIYGGLDYDTTPPKWTYYTEAIQVYLFPHYNNFNGDIAILRTNTVFKKLEPAKLPIKLFRSVNINRCWILGFGEKSNNSFENNLFLTKLSIKPKGPMRCELRSLFFILKLDFICYTIPENGFGPCKGDSGGPLYCDDRIVGVLSRRTLPFTCGTGNSITFYENVYSYREWIEQIMQSPIANSKSSSFLLYNNIQYRNPISGYLSSECWMDTENLRSELSEIDRLLNESLSDIDFTSDFSDELKNKGFTYVGTMKKTN
ncbi:kallikrein-6-like [Lycorma delicatula]|uniref:kallikrein-6-like n=1 Tax=Lycorma delicatula TaxID=130591 RepID=UPI003F510689